MSVGREQALQYAAGLRGLTLVRSGEKYALVHYVVSETSLDEIETFLASSTDGEAGAARAGRGPDLRAMLRAEHALLVEMADKRRIGERSSERASTEAALAEIRRRIAELQTEMGHRD